MHQVFFLLCFGTTKVRFFSLSCAPHLARIDEPWNTDNIRRGTETLGFFFLTNRVPLM